MSRQLSRLIRIELESYLHDLVVWSGAILLLVLFLSFMGTVIARSGDPLSDLSDLVDLVLLSVGLPSVLFAVQVSRRNSVEKRTRLFSQLPVSVREVSLASWCVRVLCLLIPTLAFTVFVARTTNMPFATFALVTLATYLGGTTLVAAISVAKSIPRLPSPISVWVKGVYIACAIVAVVIWFLGNMLVFPRFPFTAIGSLSSAGLPGLIGCLMVSGVGLVVLDIWLRDRRDDYLG